ncbi:hypothetical protein CHI10_09720 [Bacillus sp. 7894-2]|nr:hypothetical protein CHI10_09720 [Bacillus sp. 7894-2]
MIFYVSFESNNIFHIEPPGSSFYIKYMYDLSIQIFKALVIQAILMTFLISAVLNSCGNPFFIESLIILAFFHA